MDRLNANRKVIVADDHAVVRDGIIALLQGLPDVDVITQVSDGLSAIAQVKKHQPDLLVLDAAMPGAKGIEVLADTRRWSPDTAIILLTGFTSAGILANWLAADVDGILLKSCENEEMLACFETVLSGGRFVARSARDILERTTSAAQLTNREREVLSLIAMGHQNSGIASRLSISTRTVEKHRASLMEKVGVHSIAELVAYALREGLLDQQTQL